MLCILLNYWWLDGNSELEKRMKFFKGIDYAVKINIQYFYLQIIFLVPNACMSYPFKTGHLYIQQENTHAPTALVSADCMRYV